MNSEAAVRWVLALPAALAAYSVVVFLTVLAAYSEGGGHVTLPYIAIPGHLIAAGVFVWVGTKIAPSHRQSTAMVLAAVLAIIVTGLITLGIMGHQSGRFSGGWEFGCGVTTVASGIVTAWRMNRGGIV